MLPNIVLIGFMGCGKSTVGRRLSALTGHRFVDTDELVIQAEKRGIPEIFASVGEEGFREIEERIIRDLVGVAGIVLSTGGGAILREANRAALKKTGVVVWLDSDPDILFERAIRSGKRPLLNTPNPRETFDSLAASRRAVYESASHFRFDSSRIEMDEVAKRVLDECMRYLGRQCGPDRISG